MTYGKDVHESNLVKNIDSNLPLLPDLADFMEHRDSKILRFLTMNNVSFQEKN